jgi:adenylate cyclase
MVGAALAMASEIERKFLVRSDAWRRSAEYSERFSQGYIARQQDTTVRIRTTGERAWLTIKGKANGIERPEFEYAIPVADASLMLNSMCRHTLIDKTRHFVRWKQLVWHVDEFGGRYAGLVVAEVELRTADQAFDRPDWLGREVTGQTVFQNAALATMTDQEAHSFMRRFTLSRSTIPTPLGP